MGNRNPYRISVDQETGFLYWGEVGPDAAKDTVTRGPRGYDEVNQARKAGYFGWPFFVGNNYAYRKFDYNTGVSGDPYDPAKPLNTSRNNTGLQSLPPANPPLVYYPYALSEEFPQAGTGGRNAMAGPVYHVTDNKIMPDYYDDKFFMYDWIRGWIKAVTLLPNGDFDKMEPFMASTKFNAPIDMEVGPDGKIYVLEYGSGWFAKNPEAALSRIDYNAGELKKAPAPPEAPSAPAPPVDSAAFGHQQKGPEGDTAAVAGKNLIETLDCKACHKEAEKSVGPAYRDVAKKYSAMKKTDMDHLIDKLINGGSGVWGEVVMPAHPALTKADAQKLVSYIMSLK